MIYKIKKILLLKGDLWKPLKMWFLKQKHMGLHVSKGGKIVEITFSFPTNATTPMTQFTCAKKQVLNHPTLLCMSNCLGWQFY